MSTVLPDTQAVVAGHGRAALLTADGELLALPAAEAAARLRAGPPPMLVHAPATFRRLGLSARPAYDLLELFAFVHPGRAAAPTPRGLALALGPDAARGPGAGGRPVARAGGAAAAPPAAGRGTPLNRDAAALAARMGQAGWGWAPFVTAALGRPEAAPSGEGLRVWKRLPEWEDAGPPPPPSSLPVAPPQARARLADCSARRPSSARASPTMPTPPPPPSPRASCAATRTWCWPRPARAPARRSAMSRRPASGRSATAARSGSAPSPAICSARSTASSRACIRTRPSAAAAWCCARGGRTTCACSTTRTRCRPRSAASGRPAR